MPGRGDSEKYLSKAGALSEEIIEEHFKSCSDEVKAAVIKGVFDAYAANIIPSYILETEGY
jgi:hypothetical protein